MTWRAPTAGLVCGALADAVHAQPIPAPDVIAALILIAAIGGLSILVHLLNRLARSWAARWRGAAGERAVRRSGARVLPDDVYRPFHDVLLPTPTGTTQVDHIYISRYGVFVVETKNWSGRVYGRPDEHYWTQMYGDGRTHTALNPLRQSAGHVSAVRTALGLSRTDRRVRSVVVFMGDVGLPDDLPAHVRRGPGWTEYVLSFREPVFTDSEAAGMARRLMQAAVAPTPEARRRHIAHVRDRSAAGRGRRR